MERQKAKAGSLRIHIGKQENDANYCGSMDFDNGEVLAEALAVLMQQGAIKLGVSIDLMYAKVATLLFVPEEEAEADG